MMGIIMLLKCSLEIETVPICISPIQREPKKRRSVLLRMCHVLVEYGIGHNPNARNSCLRKDGAKVALGNQFSHIYQLQ